MVGRTPRKPWVFVVLVGVACGGQSIHYLDESGAGAEDDSVPSGGTSGAPSVPSGGRSGTSVIGGTTSTGGSPLDECGAIRAAYEVAVQTARSCDPADQFACNGAVASSLPCGCPLPVISTPDIANAARRWIDRGCDGSSVLCPPCPSVVPPYGCTADGLCTMR